MNFFKPLFKRYIGDFDDFVIYALGQIDDGRESLLIYKSIENFRCDLMMNGIVRFKRDKEKRPPRDRSLQLEVPLSFWVIGLSMINPFKISIPLKLVQTSMKGK